jgi:transport protein, putative
MCMFYFYYQNQLPDLKDWQISVVMLIGSALNILAVYLASMIGKRYSALKLFPSVVLLTGASYLLSYFGTPVIYILIYLISNALYALFQPIFDNDLQKQLPSEVRATMLSVYSMMFSLSMIVIFPLTGWLIDNLGFDWTFIVLGIFLLVLTPVLFWILKLVAGNLKDKV